MKKLILSLFLALIYSSGFTQTFPAKPSTLVNDYTGTLSATQKQQLENKLVAYDDSTSTQISIAILKSVGEYDINEYALGLGRSWGVGSGKKNNGIMIVVALGDRKISIQTGYGLEGAIPDIITKRIIDNEIKPSFKEGDYYAGLDAGTTALIKYAKGEYKNDNPKVAQQHNGNAIFVVLVIIIIIVIIIRRGGGSGGSQVLGGRGTGSGFLTGMLLGGALGRSSGGGNWGGGSGGDSGGGGFGGFGGGSFGGGGSSGSW